MKLIQAVADFEGLGKVPPGERVLISGEALRALVDNSKRAAFQRGKSRPLCPEEDAGLAESLAMDGQLTPCLLAFGKDGSGWHFADGFRRATAMIATVPPVPVLACVDPNAGTLAGATVTARVDGSVSKLTSFQLASILADVDAMPGKRKDADVARMMGRGEGWRSMVPTLRAAWKSKEALGDAHPFVVEWAAGGSVQKFLERQKETSEGDDAGDAGESEPKKKKEKPPHEVLAKLFSDLSATEIAKALARALGDDVRVTLLNDVCSRLIEATVKRDPEGKLNAPEFLKRKGK